VIADLIVNPLRSITLTNSTSLGRPASNLLTAKSTGERHQPTVPAVFSFCTRTSRFFYCFGS